MRPNSGVWLTKERLEDRLLSPLFVSATKPFRGSIKEIAKIKPVIIREDVREHPPLCYEWRL